MHTRRISYRDNVDNLELEGYLAYDDSKEAKRPGILVCHGWNGLDKFARSKAKKLAKRGYVGFALDMYGKGILATSNEEAERMWSPFDKDRAMVRRRGLLGLTALSNQEVVDLDRIGAIGYCFGGMCVLELARSGANLRGVVSFHGQLNSCTPKDAKNIKCNVLALQGYEDPWARQGQIVSFQKEMNDAKVDWQLHIYGGTAHAFTNPDEADYNPVADSRSWKAMLNFFKGVFG